jgi:hypothetical protein
MNEINVGDFVEIDTKNLSITEQCRKYIIVVTGLLYNDCNKILELKGIIVDSNIQNSSFKLFKKT